MTDIISEIHASPWKGVIAITGCGPSLVNDLLAPGGGSATLLEAVVPYATKSLEQFIGRKPAKEGWKFCSSEVAAEMASAAFSRSTELLEVTEGEDCPVFGLGITATLRKNGPEREGRIHQVYLSFQTATFAYNHHVVFDNKLTRIEEENLVSQVALDVLSRHLLDKRCQPLLPVRAMGPGGTLKKDGWWVVKESTERQQYPSGLQNLLDANNQNSHQCWVWHYKKPGDYKLISSIDVAAKRDLVVIPGSFNPFHDGHQAMVEIATKHFGKKPILELSIRNVDKGQLSGHEILSRGEAFADSKGSEIADLYFTDAPTFVEKSFIFTGAIFIIGIDTWYRFIDPKYYRHDRNFMNECHNKIKENGCSFLVLGRFVNGSYHTLPSDKKTKGFAVGLSEEEFRVDISSTQLRKQ